MQAVAVKAQQHLLNNTVVKTVNTSGIFEPEISGGSGTARSRGCDDWDDEE
jgi:hypothetical protein